jgi:acetoin:2,6-dichlorophenolindophenol oxidoreductase subunit alpha
MPDHTDEVAMSRDFLRSVFHSMLRARILENKLSSLYKAGKIVGGVYLGRGQEAVSATLGTALIQGKDFFAPLIRDQAGRTAFGEPLLDCTRTYLGSAQGPMRGRDGNIHRGRPAMGMPAMISHLGAQVRWWPACFSPKRLQGTLDGRVGATCIGDGASSTGAFHEGLNLAAVEKLPLVVVIGNNQFAYSTPNERQFACARSGGKSPRLRHRRAGGGWHGSAGLRLGHHRGGAPRARRARAADGRRPFAEALRPWRTRRRLLRP